MDFKENIQSQYLASLEMLEQAVIKCPDDLWDDQTYKNPFWQVVYHTLFFTHLYLQPREQDFVPWAKNRRGIHEMGKGGEPYNKEELLEYFGICREEVKKQVATLEPDAPSGFGWLPFNKLEVQLYNIRHLMQHTGELYERLGVARDIELDWVSKGE